MPEQAKELGAAWRSLGEEDRARFEGMARDAKEASAAAAAAAAATTAAAS